MRSITWDFVGDISTLLASCRNKCHRNDSIHLFCKRKLLIVLYVGKLERRWIETSRIGYYGYRKDGLLLIGVLKQTESSIVLRGISFYDFFLIMTLILVSVLLSFPHVISGLIWGVTIIFGVAIINYLNNADSEILYTVKNHISELLK